MIFRQPLNDLLLLVFTLFVFSFTVTQTVSAITFDEFRFKLDEALRRKTEAESEIISLKAQLEDMVKLGTSLEDRKVYSEELIKVVAELEKIKREIAELKLLLPKVKITPVLKLTRIDPGNVPGKYNYQPMAGNDRPLSLQSIRIKQFPLEIVPDRQFTLNGDIIWRQFFAKGPCLPKPQSQIIKGHPVLVMNAGPEPTPIIEQGVVSVSINGKELLNRYCENAPSAQNPNTGEQIVAEHEKELRLKFTLEFYPQGSDKRQNGLTAYRYRVKASSSGNLSKLKSKGVLLVSSKYTSGNGFCLADNRRDCAKLFIEFGGLGTGGHRDIVLKYEQIAPGDPFIRRIPKYTHPAKLNVPPLVGDISYSTTVPNLTGLELEDAEARLERANLKYNVADYVMPSTLSLAGKVQSTLPKAGQDVEIGATVALTLYAKKLKIPKVVNLSSKEAKRALAKAGFEYKVSLGDQAASQEWEGKVYKQSPASGTVAPLGSIVSLSVYGPKPKISPEESCLRAFPGSVPSGEINATGGYVCICPKGKQWNDRSKTHCISIPSPDESCARSYPGSYASNRKPDGGYICICPDDMQWNTNKTKCVKKPSPDESCALSYPGSYASGRNAAGGYICDCPAGKLWNRNKTRCINKPQLTEDQRCARDLPGSYFSGQRNPQGGLICNCPDSKQWNRSKTRCVDAPPPLTEAQRCARDFPGSVFNGNRDRTGRILCDCAPGKIWNSDKTRCITPPRMSDAQICSNSFYGSIPSGRRDPVRGPECVCPPGKVWNNTRTACVNASQGRSGEDMRCVLINDNIKYARQNNDHVVLQSQMSLARSLGCRITGGGSSPSGNPSGGGENCIYTEGLLGQDDPDMANCRCNGRPAPLWRCGR